MADTESDIIARAQLKRLRGSGSIEIDKDAILDNYVEVEYKDRLDTITDSKEREKYKKEITKEYLTGELKDWFQDKIDSLKDMLKRCEDTLKSAKTAITQITASNSIPAVITTGSATSVSNPAYTLIDNAQKKQTLMTVIKQINSSIQEVMAIALMLHWALPDSVVNFIELYTTISSLVNAIPG